MSDHSKIEWTDATWGPVTGCTRVSPGCDHCYIERTVPFRVAHRSFDGEGPGSKTGVAFHPERLTKPLHWRKPRRVFVNSMSDLFHKDVPDEYIAQVFAVMALAPQHTFQVLTKRPARMRSLLSSYGFRCNVRAALAGEIPGQSVSVQQLTDIGMASEYAWPLRNVWLGVSAEDQKWADIRIPILLDTPAAVRFVSAEPLLGAIDFTGYLKHRPNGLREAASCPVGIECRHGHDVCPICDGDPLTILDWVIVGGESGPDARPMHPDWPRAIRDQCQAAGVAFHFKQAGEALAREWGCKDRKGGDPAEWPEPFPREYPSA